ncbi:MAG TPA: hypothetical protein VFH40_08340 [Gemmatimonadales bacterium]|jgi:hypothetical protein|nr:hypothetical protein [Gemmatimonadales bacterium]
MNRTAGLALIGAVVLGCTPPKDAPPPKSTLVIGLDVSGSFRKGGHFDDAIDFASLYIYSHMKGLKGLRQPSDVFVGTMGGQRPGEAKTFHPIQDLTGKTPAQIAASLRAWFPEDDPITDYNAFFERVAVHVQRQNLGLAPLSIVMFSDGVPDIPGARGDELYRRVNMKPLEYLSRSVTVRLLYASPKVAQRWEKLVPRNRVRLWTQDAEVMEGWRRHVVASGPPERQDSLWSWMKNIVDFRVRRGKAI